MNEPTTVRLAARDAVYVYTDEASNGDTPNIMTSLYVFDAAQETDPIDTRARATEWVLERLDRTPALRRRLHRVPGDLDYPYWVEADVDPDRHVVFRHIGQTTRRDLHRRLASIAESPLDFTRPPWEIHVLTEIRGIADLPDGGTIVVLRAHHSITDGGGLARIARALFDDSADPPSTERPAVRIVGPVEAALKLPGAYVRLFAAALRARKARKSLAALARSGAVTDPLPQRPRTRFNVDDTGPRDFGRVRFGLGEVRGLAHRTGTTVNDVMLAVVASALHAYLVGRGEPPAASLGVQVPIALRDRPDLESENKTTLMFVDLHTDEPDPLTRLRLIHDSASREKDRLQRTETTVVESILDHLPAVTLRRLARRANRPVAEPAGELVPMRNTFLASGARGAAAGFRFGGSPAVDGFAVACLNRSCGLMHAGTSLGDSLNVTFSSKDASMPDPAEYELLLARAFEELRSTVARDLDGETRPDL